MTTQRMIFAAAVLGTLLVRPSSALPCTTFLMEQDGPVVGKSYDWDIGYGLVVINKRGVDKRALVLSGQDTPATWTSQYASVTFNQYGTEFPNSGMNEAGLVVEIMWLDSSQYPGQDERPVVNELQWIQRALDTCATVDEVIAGASALRVSPAYAAVHYLACDATGTCAAFEYLGGQLVITSGDEMVVNTLTNNTYADSVAHLADFVGFGGSDPIPSDSGSLSRFVRASSLALADHSQTVPDSAFAILDTVRNSSVWNLVYRPDLTKVWFRTQVTTSIKSLDLSAFDLDCAEDGDALLLDIDTTAAGDVTGDFAPYDYDTNLDLIDRSYADIINYLPPGTPGIVAAYPEAQHCNPPDDNDGDGDGDGNADGDGGGGCAVQSHGHGGVTLLVLAMWLGVIRRRRASR